MKKKTFAFITMIIMAFSAVGVFQPLSMVMADPRNVSAMEELQETELGQLPPGSLVEMKTFIKAAVAHITFEQGEDPIYIARKQHYIAHNGIKKGFIHRNDVLLPLLRMTDVAIPKHGDLVQLAKETGIILQNNKELYEKNIPLTAAVACEMIVNTRKAWYGRLDAEFPAKRFDPVSCYFSLSHFTFSADGKYLWFIERDSAKAMNTSDGTVSSADRPQPPPKEEYPAKEGENATCIYDNAGVLRAVTVEVTKRHNYVTAKYILYRENPQEPWRRLIDFDLSLTRDFEITGFTPDNQKMYVKTNFYDNYVTLYELNPKTMSRKAVYHNARADVAVDFCANLVGVPVSSLRHPQTGRILTVLYLNDKARLVCLDSTMREIMKKATEDLGENQYPIAITPDFHYVVLIHTDYRDLGSYRIYDTRTRTARLIAASGIPAKDVGHTYPVSFKASDGRTVFAFLTVPLGESPRNLPLFINAHGGPQAKYFRTVDSYAFLASNLGAAVLSVDFRFSLGYGNEYTDSASRNKLLAQQDIFEACQWAVAQGIANPNRIGVMGHSYGGYSAFYQAAVHPDVYKAAIALMGIWDWTDLGNELTGGQPVPDDHKCSAPEPGTELAKMMSPSSYAGQLKCPILIVYSGKDQAVYPSQNIRAIKELKEAGNMPKVLYLPDMDHVPSTVASFEAIYHSMEDFLKQKFFLSE